MATAGVVLVVGGIWIATGQSASSSHAGDDGPSAHAVSTPQSSTVGAAAPEAAGGAPHSAGVPVEIDLPFSSAHYPHGVHAAVTANPLNPDGSLFVPADPRVVSWARQDAAPGSSRGTVILTSHINFVIAGHNVPGAFVDLAEYARTAVGHELRIRLADGRSLTYRVVSGSEYRKDQLATDPALRESLFNQTRNYAGRGHPSNSRLLLVSCGGAFDDSTGQYENNVFLYALPVTTR